MARRKRAETRPDPPAPSVPAAPVRRPWALWAGVMVSLLVVAGAWWGSGLLVRQAQGALIPPLGDLSRLPEPVRAQLQEADARAREHPRSANAAGALGMAWHASLVTERALEEYARAAALDETAWIWTYYRALLLEEHGRQVEAAEALAIVTRDNPVLGLAWFRLAEIAFKEGRLDEAERAYVRAGQAPPLPPFAPPGVVRRTVPLAAYARVGLARVALDRGLRDQAEATLDAVVADFPSFGAGRSLRVQLASDSLPASEQVVTAAYVPPSDPLLDAVVAESRMRNLLLKHAALAARGEDPAWRDFLVRRALQFTPGDPNVLMEMASMLRSSGRCAEALDYLRRREQLIPDDHVTLIEQGRCLSDLGRLAEAEAVLRRATRIRDAAAEYNLGAVLDRQGKGDEARTHYERALDIDPFNARAMSNLGVWYDRRGQTASAVALLQRAVRAAPDNAEMYSNLGSVLIGARRLPDALRALGTAIALDPDAPEAHNNLGIALAQMGRLAEAAREFQRALELNPNHLNARRNLERLKAMR